MSDLSGATLLAVYHRPFWRAEDGSFWEREGAFSRHIESLAAHFSRILIAAPQSPNCPRGYRIDAPNVRLVALPFFDGVPGFWRVLPGVVAALWRGLDQADIVSLRLPTPAGALAFVMARVRRRPVFLLVVGDLAAAAGSVPTDTVRRRIYHLYVRIEEWLLQAMVNRALTVTNGPALYQKHARPGQPIVQTLNSTIRSSDVQRPREAFIPPRARILCVSRIDLRKGLRYLPEALAVLREQGFAVSLDVLGPTVGPLGEQELHATFDAARRLGLETAVAFHGAASLGEVYAAYTSHDLLLVPSLPGEGIPRVLLEGMAAGIPIVATRVGGIPDVVTEGESGLLVEPGDGLALGSAAARLLANVPLRKRCVESGYRIASAHTCDAQAARLVDVLRPHICRSQLAPEQRSAPRINIPLASLNLSGGVKSLLMLANRLAQRGARVRVLVPDYSQVPPLPLNSAIEVKVLPTLGAGRWRQIVYFARLATDAAAGADLVLANYFLTVYPVVLSRLVRARGAALAYNVRGYEPSSHGLMAPAGLASRYFRFLLALLTYRLPLTKLVTTEWLKRRLGDENAIVVGHGIDLDTFRPIPNTPSGDNCQVVVGVVGRLGSVKGYSDFLRAAQLLRCSSEVRIRVAVLDPVPLPDNGQIEVVRARTEPEMAEFFRRCDIFVFPSLVEGFGLPALEAMACGCAVITTDCGGVSTFARPGENCVMVPPGRPDLLANAIERLVADSELRGRLAAQGPLTARAFDRELALERLADIVLTLAARH